MSPVPPVAATPAAALPSTGLWRRLMAAVYEGIILFGVVFFFAYAFSALTQYQDVSAWRHTALQWYLFGILGVYFVWFWSHGRRTLPMKTMSLLLVDRTGGPVGVGRATLRYVLASLACWGLLALVYTVGPWLAPVWGLPWAWAWIDRDRQTLYDRIAGTRLVIHDPVRERAAAAAVATAAADSRPA